MTKSSTTYTNTTVSTIALYKAYHSAISAQINAVLARTGDTGQVNWTTIATLPGSGVVRDYEVFAFNDSLQATKPIYVRFDYDGVASGAQNINVTIGTSTDGAGNIGGFSTAKVGVAAFAPTSASSRTVYASSDGSYLMLALNLQGSAGTQSDGLGAVVIERTRDLDGTANGNGFMCWRWNATSDTGGVSTNYFIQTQARLFDASVNGNAPFVVADPNVFIPNAINTSTALYGSTAYAYPAYTMTALPQGASKALMVGWGGDWPRQSVVTITHYGIAMNFLSMGPSATMNVPTMGTQTSATYKNGLSPLFRWE